MATKREQPAEEAWARPEETNGAYQSRLAFRHEFAASQSLDLAPARSMATWTPKVFKTMAQKL